jgi:hypothetical protein
MLSLLVFDPVCRAVSFSFSLFFFSYPATLSYFDRRSYGSRIELNLDISFGYLERHALLLDEDGELEADRRFRVNASRSLIHADRHQALERRLRQASQLLFELVEPADFCFIPTMVYRITLDVNHNFFISAIQYWMDR